MSPCCKVITIDPSLVVPAKLSDNILSLSPTEYPDPPAKTVTAIIMLVGLHFIIENTFVTSTCISKVSNQGAINNE